MKVSFLVRYSLVVLLLAFLQSAEAQELRPAIKDSSAKKPAEHTTTDEVLSGNPIKLTVSKDDLSSELPRLDEPLAIGDAVQLGLKNNLEFLA